MKPHKHAEFIKQWADGAEIQFYSSGGSWVDDPDPSWNCEKMIFRLKPEEKKPVVRWLWAHAVRYKQGGVQWMPASKNGFLSEDEAKRVFGNDCVKMENTRTEFPE